MSGLKHADDRMRNDPFFASLVKQLEAAIEFGDFTPSEVREALLLAQMRFEMNHPRPITFSPDLMRELEFRMKK